MKFLQKAKDGGPESTVDAFILVEIKNLFSIMFLKFNEGGREKYHSHAFNAFTWFLKGTLREQDINGDFYWYKKSFKPKFTSKDKFHRVYAFKDSWCLTIRGPWRDTWLEYDEKSKVYTTLTHGRRVIGKTKLDTSC